MIVTVTNHKGGVGKTTVALNIADALALRDIDVAALDTTAQGSLAKFLEDVPVTTALEGVSQHASTLASQHAWLVIDTPAPSFDGDTLGYDRPTQAMLDAIALADLVVIPTSPNLLDVATTIDAIATVHEHGREGVRVVVVFNKVDSRSKDASAARQAFEEAGAHVLTTELTQLKTYARSPGALCGVIRFEPGSRAADQVIGLVDEITSQAWVM